MLLAQTNFFANTDDVILDRFAIDFSLARSHVQHASQHVNASRLASPIMPKQSKNLVLLDRHSELVYSLEVAELHGHALELNWILKIDFFCANAL